MNCISKVVYKTIFEIQIFFIKYLNKFKVIRMFLNGKLYFYIAKILSIFI